MCHTYLAVDVQLCVLALPFLTEQFSTQMTMILANGFRTRSGWLLRQPAALPVVALSLFVIQNLASKRIRLLSTMPCPRRLRPNACGRTLPWAAAAMLSFAVMFVRFVEKLLNDVQQSHDPSWAECLDRTDVRDASREQLRVADLGAPNRVTDSVVECPHARETETQPLLRAPFTRNWHAQGNWRFE